MQVDPGSILGSGRSPGEGIGYSLQYSGLENSRDCIVMGSQSQTWLSDFKEKKNPLPKHMHTHFKTSTLDPPKSKSPLQPHHVLVCTLPVAHCPGAMPNWERGLLHPAHPRGSKMGPVLTVIETTWPVPHFYSLVLGVAFVPSCSGNFLCLNFSISCIRY